MIIGSIALVAVSAVLWLIGLRESSDQWYFASIVGSVLAAFALMVGVRLRARARMPEDDFDIDTLHPAPDWIPLAPRPIGRAQVPSQPVGGMGLGEPAAAEMSLVSEAALVPEPPADDGLGPEPPDEPPAQLITEREALQLAEMTADVVVTDGRPRYHAAGCLHLLGRETERLPVNEAMQLGFTPCGQCEPARGLLAVRQRP